MMPSLGKTSAFAEALVSPGMAIPAEAQIFEAFIGSWDLVVRWFAPDGSLTREEGGEWHFERVLEGRGIQDIWIVPARGSRQAGRDYEYGTSIRFFDPASGKWQSTWIGPMHALVRTFAAARIEDQVVLETTAGELPHMRWSFFDIGKDTFRWKNEVEEGGRWRVQQTFEAVRSN